MKIKEKFELIESGGTGAYNVLPISDGTLSAFALSQEESMYVRTLVKMYAQTRKVPAPHFVLKHINDCIIARIPEYPLETSCTAKFTPVVNITEKSISDLTPQNAYALVLNALALTKMLKTRPFRDSIEMDISIFLYATLMKLYGKKSGLMGSYTHLMPRLKFICFLYTHCGLLGLPDNIQVRNTIAAKLFTTIDDLKLDGIDFSTTHGFLEAIRINEIIPTSIYKFSTSIINISGASSLPIFEDLSRLHANLISAVVPSSNVFSNFWLRIPGETPTKIIKNALFIIER